MRRVCPFAQNSDMETKRDLAARKNVEEDLQRLIPGAKLVGTTGFGDAIIRRMQAA